MQKSLIIQYQTTIIIIKLANSKKLKYFSEIAAF